jgi:hypothetical protein
MFNVGTYQNMLAERIASELDSRREQFANNTISGLAIDCHPWHKVLELCFCSELDEVAVAKHGKWCLADWRFFQFTRTPAGDEWPASRDICEAMFEYCENDLPDTDPDEYGRRTTLMFQVCADALNSEAVKSALKNYNLSGDFELYVRHPDTSKLNLCAV